MKGKLALLTALATLGSATAAVADDQAYSVIPVPQTDARLKFLPPAGSVYVVDQESSLIRMCFPDTDKDGNYVVVCTATTDLGK